MTRRWKKLGKIYSLEQGGLNNKLKSHAANPLAIQVDGDLYRVFFSSRDDANRSSVGAIDFDLARRELVRQYDNTFFEHGRTGSFYSDGVSIGNCYEVGGVTYMMFMGWQRPRTGHWRGDIGRLVLTSNFTLALDSSDPYLTADAIDPVSLSYPWVLPAKDGGFDMWYGSTISWDVGNGEMLHVINHATSDDGHRWSRHGLALPYKLGYAQAFSRPAVVRNCDGSLEMWFSYRSGGNSRYRIGYAKKTESSGWVIDVDKSGITVSDQGWDSEMVEYPFVLDHDGERYMFYNGNGYGHTGFGLAILEK